MRRVEEEGNQQKSSRFKGRDEKIIQRKINFNKKLDNHYNFSII